MAKGVTKERIVAAALEVLDESGIDGVTLRAVAARLDVRAPALYWHVPHKQELLDEMGTEIERRIQGELGALPTGIRWSDWLAAYGRIVREEYLAHRDGARTFSGTRLTDVSVLRSREPVLVEWTAAGLSLEQAMDAVEIVAAFVVGFVIEEQERAQSAEADPLRYSLAERDAALGADSPLVAAAAHRRGDDDERFSRQLDAVVAGLSARFA